MNVADRELLVQRLRIERSRVRRFEDLLVIGASGDGLFEDRRVGGHAAQAVFIDQAAQLAAGDQAAANVVEPHRLAEDLQRAQPVLQRRHLGEPAQMALLAREARVQEARE